MSYEVRLTERAKADLDAAVDWIAERAPETAERWFNGFVEALITLQDKPHRCPLARENGAFPFELRQFLYGRRRSYRVLFTAGDDAVVVLAIRHAAQRDLSTDDL